MTVDSPAHTSASTADGSTADRTGSISGVLVVVHGSGVLLLGESGCGKSELALTLLDRGHRLVADDVVDLRREGDRVVGRAPEALRGLLELRGIGLCPVAPLYGDQSLQDAAPIDTVISLLRPSPGDWAEWPRIEPRRCRQRLLDLAFDCLELPATGERPLGPLVEAVVRLGGPAPYQRGGTA